MKILKNLFKKNILDMNNIPKHIAIIMDGNGRWAKHRGLPRNAGHSAGANVITKIAEACGDLGVKYLTVYAFSTENWSRPKEEVDYLMDLFSEYFDKIYNDKRNKDIKIKVIGQIDSLPEKLKEKIIKIENLTKDNIKLQLNLAINYGGRDEIIKAIKEIAKEILEKQDKEAIEKIDSDTFEKHLYTKDMPDPEVIIRTSGEMRLSNFLLYQAAYSEFWFTNVLWPDFTKEHLMEAIFDYQRRHRRFGGI